MLNRFSIKIGGQSGTGINTVGLILSKAFKRLGFYVVSYREYPSLIKGGFASYKIDISNKEINAVSRSSQVFVAIDKWSFETLLEELEENSIFIIDKNIIRPSDEQKERIAQKNVVLHELPLTLTAKQVGGNTIMKNTVLMGALWNLLGLDPQVIVSVVGEIFNKTKEIEESNINCAKAGIDMLPSRKDLLEKYTPDANLAGYLSISGNEAIALGAIAGGVRAYFAYPMTPSSSILHTMSKLASKSGVVIKQAEDEITAVNMTIGANHAGTRAMTATSGGGFDLMTEALSLAGITETPLVVGLAQRPGPGTGAPTWTTQGDLKIAVFGGHGEFPRIILAPGDVEECFDMTWEAHNLAEKYQVVVIILTDKYLAETLFTSRPFKSELVTIDRGDLITENFDKAQERYEITESGVSPRWLPGAPANTFVGNSDEHTPHGNSTEEMAMIKTMIDKRMRKEKVIIENLPEPELFGQENADVSIIAWGSSKHIILDAMEELKAQGKNVNFLYFKYVYPIKTEKLKRFIESSKNLLVIENNEVGQLADMIQMKLGILLPNRFLKYDGRPFFVEEIIEKINTI